MRGIDRLPQRGGIRRNRQRTNRFGRVWVAAAVVEWVEVRGRARAEGGWVDRLLRGREGTVFALVVGSEWLILRGSHVCKGLVLSVE